MKYQFIKQHDITDCGAACLAMILQHYGSYFPLSRIREIAGTDRQGTSAYGMVKAAEKLGFEAEGVEGDKEALLSSFQLPVIAHVVIDGSLLHYVVIYEITREKIIVADPAKGIVNYSLDEFCKIWSGVLIMLKPGKNFQRQHMKSNIFADIMKLLLPQKKILLPIFIISLLITFAGIAASFYYMLIMDYILPNDTLNILLPVSLGFIVLLSVKNLLEYFRSRLILLLSQHIDLALIPEYGRHLLHLPVSFYGMRKSGEVVSRYEDAAKIRDIVSEAALTVMLDTFMAIGGGVVLFLQNKILFLIALTVLVMYAAVIIIFSLPIRKANEQVMEDNAQFASYLYESVKGIETIKTMNGENISQNKSVKLYDKFWKSIRHNYLLDIGQSSITQSMAAVGEILILWYGTVCVLQGQMSIGTLITFHALLVYFLSPVQNLLNLQPKMQTAIAAGQRLKDIMDLSPENYSEPDNLMRDITGKIDISHVSFRYGTRELVLQDISMSIKPGEKIALVGESGSGKTTLAKLLLRFYAYEVGKIKLDDNDIHDIPLHLLRSRIAYISQNTFLFSGTIKENLLFAKSDASDEEIISACKMSKADEFIDKMPLGLNTYLDENGMNLSGGQRQRLAIARALLRKPKILILDEATSNLDIVTERAIGKTFQDLTGITIILIAHRLTLVRNCSYIYLLKDGRIIEHGNHKSLLQLNKIYASLWNEQSGEKSLTSE